MTFSVYRCSEVIPAVSRTKDGRVRPYLHCFRHIHRSSHSSHPQTGAYSATSILMQLQSFLFAEKIDQDGGYVVNAQISDQDVKASIKTCKTLMCKCGHNHLSQWPKVKGPPEALIKVYPTDPASGHVEVQGSAAQTTHSFVHFKNIKI